MLFIPTFILGMSSLTIGIRFGAYMIPILSLGLVFLLFLIIKIIRIRIIVKIILIAGALTFVTFSALTIFRWPIRPSIAKPDIRWLTKLDSLTTENDYVISWWDYGYYLKYFTGMHTIVDGGSQNTKMNSLIAQIFMGQDQRVTANFISVLIKSHYLHLGEKGSEYRDIISQMVSDNKFDSANDLFTALKDSSFSRPKLNRSVYLYLPYRMLPISHMIGNTIGSSKSNEFVFYYTRTYKKVKDKIHFEKDVYYDIQKGKLHYKKAIKNVGAFMDVGNDGSGEIVSNTLYYNPNGEFVIIYLRNYDTFLVISVRAFSSNFIQMFVFERYDDSLFEPIILEGMVKVYKLK